MHAACIQTNDFHTLCDVLIEQCSREVHIDMFSGVKSHEKQIG